MNRILHPKNRRLLKTSPESRPMIDYHVHTARCKHASGEMEEYVVCALEKGLVEMAFTDHIPLALPFLEECSMNLSELDGYVSEVIDLRDRFKGDIVIRLGLEADYVRGQEKTVSDILDSYPFDLVLGSVHMMDDWAVDHPKFSFKFEEGDVLAIYLRYIEHLSEAVRTGMYDIMAHPDLVKKLNYYPENENISELFSGVFSIIAEEGVGIELSSAGLRKPVREEYPSRELLSLAVSLGIPLVTGSDAHQPDEIGRDFELLYRRLADLGVERLSVFEGRKRKEISIEQGKIHG